LAPLKSGKKITGKTISDLSQDEFNSMLHGIADSVQEEELATV